LAGNCKKKGAETTVSAPEIAIKNMPTFNLIALKWKHFC
jgi:hypothetical protein